MYKSLYLLYACLRFNSSVGVYYVITLPLIDIRLYLGAMLYQTVYRDSDIDDNCFAV